MIKNGVDIVEISRFSEMKNYDRFINYGYTKREREYLKTQKNPYPSAAAIFAVKEAFSKFLGTGIKGFLLKDIEVLHNEQGAPFIMFMGQKVNANVSISHSDDYAVATVCGDVKSDSVFKYAELLKSYRAMLPKRTEDMHKGSCGRLLVAAGSKNMVGAGCMTTMSALRCGCGLVTLAVPECIQPVAAAKLTEVMTYPLKCKDGFAAAGAEKDIIEYIESSNTLAIGPGMGKSDGVKSLLKAFVQKSSSAPCVIDADGLNVLSQNLDILKNVKSNTNQTNIILTPHPKEMERLCGYEIPKDDESRIAAATDFAAKYNVIVLLKGNRSVIASPKGAVHINESGNNGMATAGMGDVLTGVISSFCAQGINPYIAAVLGAFIHGLAGDIAAEDKGVFGMIAGDVIEALPYAIKLLAE